LFAAIRIAMMIEIVKSKCWNYFKVSKCFSSLRIQLVDCVVGGIAELADFTVESDPM